MFQRAGTDAILDRSTGDTCRQRLIVTHETRRRKAKQNYELK